MSEQLRVGVVGAGARGHAHAEQFGEIDGVEVVAVADIDEEAAAELAAEYDLGATYADYREMLAEESPDVVGVCVHNNLHAPVSIDAAEAGAQVFCEKPMAGSYADAKAMADAADANGSHLGVQNNLLLDSDTRAARTLVEDGKLGEVTYARAVRSRRRGRPYVDGYGTPSFVNSATAGGGPVYDIGTYAIGRMLHLLGAPSVERVSGQTFSYTDDAYDESMVGDEVDTYRDRIDEAGYDVEDAGTGLARLSNGAVLSVRAAWHVFLSGESDALAGSRGGVEFDPFEFRTTMDDYEATVSMDVDEYERRHGLLASETGYDAGSGASENQFEHFIRTVRDEAADPIPTGRIGLESMLVMEGIYLSHEAGRELSAAEIAERSESNALEP